MMATLQTRQRGLARKRIFHFWADQELLTKIQEDAKRSRWTVSEQIRYELAKPRGLWNPPQPYSPLDKPQSK